jgi:PAS domain S-box-containing protein
MTTELTSQEGNKDATKAKVTRITIPFDPSEGIILTACGILCISIFLFDIELRISFLVSVLYLIPVLLCIWSPKRRTIFIVAGVSSVLTLIAIPLKPPGDILIPLFNRPASLLATWTVTFLLDRYLTRRKIFEQALELSERRLRFHIENSPMAVVEWDSDFIVTRWAGEAEKIFGMTSSETVGKPIMDLNLIYPEDIPVVQRTIAGLAGGENTKVVAANRNITKEGRILYCTWYNTVVTNESGKMSSVLSLVLDNTAQVKAEEELRRSNAELQQFAYVASHDLQEPLRMVINYLSLLDSRFKGRLDPKAQEYVTFAVEGGERMRQLINDLLEYSRVETTGKEFALVNMDDVVSKTLSLLKMPIAESGAKIIVDPLPTIMADESQMMRVMQNLIGNAIKFRSQEQSRISISAAPGVREWNFSVKDNGIGLNMKYADKIFQMFQRLHTKEEYPGTGVGLAVTKKIIERHGGRIWVESEEGKGATFFFTIPVSIP